MKLNIGIKIQQLRINKGYTQDDLATLCAISSAAVSKWENNQTYPDITTLPILARIFNITIDELLNFESAIDDATVDKLIKDMIEAFNDSFKEGMQFCKTLIYTYPNSELLKLKIAGSHGTIALCLYGKPEAETNIDEFTTYAKQLCKQIIPSNDFIIRQGACILYSNFAKNDDDIRESLQYIQDLPKLMNTTSIESSLYLMLKESDKANHMLQTQLYHECSNIMLYFLSLINIAIKDERKEDALALLQLCEQFDELFHLHSMIQPQLCFQYATLEDEYHTLRLLKRYIKQMKNFDQVVPQVQHTLCAQPWFSTVTLKANAYPQGIMQKNIENIIKTAPQFTFLHDNEEYQSIIASITHT